jgi:hypothetical protein
MIDTDRDLDPDRKRYDRPAHKRVCHEVEHSSGVLKLVRMFSVNPLLMMYLKVAIVLDCDLLNDPRIGIEVPFVARVDIAFEPSDIFDFVGLYFNDKVVREKLQGMLQVNAMTPWYMGMDGVPPSHRSDSINGARLGQSIMQRVIPKILLGS